MITESRFGGIRIDGKQYEHDVVIRLSGAIEKRKKELSKKYYGSSHPISEEEIRFIFEKGCQVMVIGTGQYGRVYLTREAAAYLNQEGCQAVLFPTPEAISIFNSEVRPKIGLFHLTC